ncbi:MAG TPA: exonuclease domain-containing protein [Chloroflexota bacterium]|nr:exonuclease domain-containing protein [Chloroflexota bacterium]HUM68785.1 exonuclease domain-containing protein [Chloroflexota bacterium]
MNFVALDVETANPNLASICQIGVVTFSNGLVVDKWQSLVNPQDYFDSMNVLIHGVTEVKVSNAPIFSQIHLELKKLIENNVTVIHTSYDKVAISRAIEKYHLLPVNCTWLDTARVVRRTWQEFRSSGYGLANVAKEFNIDFEHHNAVEDARAAGEILLRAIEYTGIGLDEWIIRAYQPMPFPGTTGSSIARKGNPDGILAGEVIVFTGALSLSRGQAAELAGNAGCDVASGVNKKTTLLVVGDQDIGRLAGHDKSSKHRKAEALIGEGQNIRILSEGDFLRLLENA